MHSRLKELDISPNSVKTDMSDDPTNPLLDSTAATHGSPTQEHSGPLAPRGHTKVIQRIRQVTGGHKNAESERRGRTHDPRDLTSSEMGGLNAVAGGIQESRSSSQNMRPVMMVSFNSKN
ncbi:hypothetical protein C8Q73DRAFT_707711 [Cubamyces lactineus]|nr:hypothetical protein C8Q73DRAFT_707711 [Cubamyces lactineus]